MDATITHPNQRQRIISNPVLGIVFLLVTELMFFAGLISAYIVNKAGTVWPPVGQPRLPIEVTALNTVVLLGSAFTIYLVAKNFRQGGERMQKAHSLLVLTMVLGAVFVTIQGIEWVRLIGFGLTTTSSIFGSFFYTIIGMHGLHVLAGLTILVWLWTALKKDKPLEGRRNILKACSLYWYFVVGIWPVLYVLVYLL